MIIPSIDIMDGRSVQLRRGRELLLDGGDPLERLEEFSVAGEVAVIDLDAALGRGANTELIRRMVRRAPCRVGGGIRTVEAARDWLDAGARRVILGTAATPEVLARLPRSRVIAAVDMDHGRVVVDGWRRGTGEDGLPRIAELAPQVGGFLVTQVEHEGGLAGFDRELLRRAVEAAGEARVTAAGGISSPLEVAALDQAGVDAQVGMALYSGRFSLGEAVAATLRGGLDRGLWPTVVSTVGGASLGLVWSNRDSVRRAIDNRRGIYWSRSRGEIWIKGATSGSTQRLDRVDLDCDRDALRFTVVQEGGGFCHTGSAGCWSQDFSLFDLERAIADRRRSPAANSGTNRLLAEPALLRGKLAEEAAELAATRSDEEAVWEFADLLYFGLVALQARGGALADVMEELRRRSGTVRRRPMASSRIEGAP